MFHFRAVPERYRSLNRRGFDVVRDLTVVGKMHVLRETGRGRGRNVMTIRTERPPGAAETDRLLDAAKSLAAAEGLGKPRSVHCAERADGSWNCRVDFGYGADENGTSAGPHRPA